ncbi:MAG: TIGR01212 family radical SAM protein [Epulopiscium sp. Nele67-Bin005]|nr:MAG: TIGR01212 family radical SAM protein [Epulopiscium sp. Nele67-Bin005]
MSNTNFYTLNNFLRNRHGEKVMKLSIDGGFTCPNRDGTIGFGGCIFCNDNGSGTANSALSITSQMEEQILSLSTKWGNINKYIAYFQSYSNTYASVNSLKLKYETALSYKNIVGLAIGTRPDCLSPEIITYLSELNSKTHLWVELGLQTIHNETANFINRGYDLDCFTNAVYELSSKNIEVVAHIILGLPNETREDMLQTARFIANLPLQGVKIHMLHIVNNSPLAKLYEKNPFSLLSQEEYIELVSQILQILPKNFVIHRVTGDGEREHLVAPLWTLRKKHVLNEFNNYLRVNNIYQGCKFPPDF